MSREHRHSSKQRNNPEKIENNSRSNAVTEIRSKRTTTVMPPLPKNTMQNGTSAEVPLSALFSDDWRKWRTIIVHDGTEQSTIEKVRRCAFLTRVKVRIFTDDKNIQNA